MTYLPRGRLGFRPALLALSLAPIVLSMSGCFSSSSSSRPSEPQANTGVFIDSPVAGLDFKGDKTEADRTDEKGQFKYVDGEVITFAIGDLELGSASGAAVLTPLSLVEGAEAADDQRVTNMLILLQTLDADGDLNNGIQITEAIRDGVSLMASSIFFDQSPANFRVSLEPLISDLVGSGAFSDAHIRQRTVVAARSALEHFVRATSPRTQVTTTKGDIRGFEVDADTWQFLAIPYAKPPVGDLRWRAPEQPEAWSQPRDAISWSDQAAQNPALQRFGEGGMSEDSLYLNVTAPKSAENLPVMVWFHGGGFTSLTANTLPFNNPDAVVSKGVVQVSVNHRLGPFGYIAHPELSEETDYRGSGNYGQMDLVMALEWVRDNIAAFGGDPANVTIFGESGGGRKVLSLMASPKAKGLFHKAISQSGTLIPDTRSLAVAEAIGAELQANLEAEDLAGMRAKTWREIVRGAATLVPYTNVDNGYMPNTERVQFENSAQNDVPFMFLITANDTPDPTKTVREVFPWMAPLSESDHFAVLFSHQPAGWKDQGVKAYHASELAYLFNMPESVITHYLMGLVIDPATGNSLVIGDINGNGISGSQGDPDDILASAGFGEVDDLVIDRMLTIWTNFAKTGNPSIPGELEFPVYNAETQRYVELNEGAEINDNLAEMFLVD